MQLFDPKAPGNLIPVLNLDESEVQRQMTVCNACRYCEGFCAVFPAMTRRLEFSQADIHYLANLCHNCGACLHACQYAAPHEFEINVPKAMAKVRLDTYAEYAWPQVMGTLYRRNGLTLALSAGAGLALFLCLTLMVMGNLFTAMPGGNFYGIFPHNTLAVMFGTVFGFAVLALTLGARRFWRNVSPAVAPAQEKPLLRWKPRPTSLGSNFWTVAMARAAITLMIDSPCGGGASTTSPSTDSCCASQLLGSPRSTISFWTGRRPTPS